jgi:dsRNA-specific ribonuclease
VTIAPAIIAAAVALVVAVLTPTVTSLRARRQAINDKFDEAIAALLLVQGARHIATSIARHYHPGTDQEYRAFTVKTAEDSISEFIKKTADARDTLAALRACLRRVGVLT